MVIVCTMHYKNIQQNYIRQFSGDLHLLLTSISDGCFQIEYKLRECMLLCKFENMFCFPDGSLPATKKRRKECVLVLADMLKQTERPYFDILTFTCINVTYISF